MKEKSKQPIIEEKESIQEKTSEVFENQDFTELDLKKKWQEFTIQMSESDRFLLDRNIILQDNKAIQIELDNQLMADRLEKIYQKDLLDFLKKELKNQSIHLEVSIKKQEVKKRLYTSLDKFEHLAEKYPALNDLKDRFDLNINP